MNCLQIDLYLPVSKYFTGKRESISRQQQWTWTGVRLSESPLLSAEKRLCSVSEVNNASNNTVYYALNLTSRIAYKYHAFVTRIDEY